MRNDRRSSLTIIAPYKCQATIDAVLDGAPVTIKSGARELSRVENRIVAAPAASLKAAGMQAHEAGWTVHILGDAIEGEASEVARYHAARALDIRASLKPQDPPVVLLSGGESTVTNRGNGTGGPSPLWLVTPTGSTAPRKSRVNKDEREIHRKP